MKTIDMQDALRLVNEGGAMSRAQRLDIQQARLEALVNYARKHSPYFKRLYSGLPEKFKLSDLPVTEKSPLLENYNEWVTDPTIKIEDVLKYLDRPADDTSLFRDKYTALKTSGSTGNPLPMVRDDFHNKIHGAMMAKRLLKGLDPDILNPSKHRIATIIHTSPGASSYNGFLKTLAAHPDHAGNMLAISVLESIDKIVDKLNEFKPAVITGYASSLVLLAIEKEKGNLDIPVELICNSAELLTDEAYRHLSESFKCPVINNYCMTEGGEIAMANGGPELFLNEDWVIVEPVNADREPVKDGSKFSDGILITDLSNFVQPIIRYYVSDRVKIKPPKENSTFPVLQIDGRAFESFVIGGKKYTMTAIVTKAEVWPGLVNYQVVQTDADTIQLRGVCAADADCNKVLGSLSRKLEEYFRNSGCENVKVTYTDAPLLHNRRGGKIPRYVNLSQTRSQLQDDYRAL